MPDLSQYSDEELKKIAGIKTEQPKDLSSYSDEELKQIASKDKSWGQFIYQDIVSSMVEAGGAIAGGIVGSGVTPIAGTVIGAGLGYAGAKRLTKGGGVALGYEDP